MTKLTRRSFTALAGASLVPLFAPAVLGQGKPKLVVIGGGPGGGTVARYVNKDHKGAIDVTLVEPQKKFTTCFFSNIYVGGYRSFAVDHPRLRQGAQGGGEAGARGRGFDRSRQARGRARGRQTHPL